MRDETRTRFYENLIVWDAHACLPLRPGQDMSALERHRAAGATFVHVNVGMDYNPLEQIVRIIAGFRSWLARHPDDFLLAETVEDIGRAKRQGKLAVAFDLEGSMMLQDDLAMLRLFRDLGVRQMHLAYNRSNSIAGGCHDSDTGLTELGRQVVQQINELGIIMDCSHMGLRTSFDVMEISTRPVVFSHSNVRALRDHPRNLTDEQIDACARTDGVIGLCGIGPFLGDNDITTATLMRHVDYVAERVGVRHVGLGLDFVFDQSHDDMPPGEERDYWYPAVSGYDLKGMSIKPPEDFPEIAGALLDRGYTLEEAHQAMGGNFLRVAEATWRSETPAVDAS
jgi:membrane dipeptidase